MPDTNPYAKYGGTPVSSQPPQPAPSSPDTTTASNPYSKYGGTLVKPPAKTTPAAQPGAYQQAPGAPIRNAKTEAENPFTDTTTSVLPSMLNTKPTGALMKRPEESDTQFLARVHEAAKHVTPEQIEAEMKADNARALPTAGAALAAGPATLGAEVGAARMLGRPALKMVEHELVDNAGKPLEKVVERNAIGYAKDAGKAVIDWAKANPKTAFVLKAVAADLGLNHGRLTHTLLKYGILGGE